MGITETPCTYLMHINRRDETLIRLNKGESRAEGGLSKVTNQSIQILRRRLRTQTLIITTVKQALLIIRT